MNIFNNYSISNFIAQTSNAGQIGNVPHTLSQAKYSNLAPLQSDVFCKFVQTQNVQKPDYTEEGIQKLYDEVLATFKKQNPMFDELNIPAPQITFAQGKEFAAAYSVFSNSIAVDKSQVQGDYYTLAAKDKSGNKTLMGVFHQDDLEPFKKLIAEQNPDLSGFETSKLTDSEKRLYLKSCIAHELRHCLQEHMCLSSDVSGEYLAFKTASVLDILNTKQEIADLYKSDADNPEYKQEYQKCTEDIENTKKEYSYILNFKPKKLLDKDTKLKLSLNPEDNRKWSVKNHFIKSQMNYNNQDSQNYNSSPAELDAYNYQKDFILSQYSGSNGKYRDDVILGIIMYLDEHCAYIDKLKQYGYEDINS